MKEKTDQSAGTRERFRIRVNGIVQGVGFRPFVFRLATELKLTGHVSNNSNGVIIELEGETAALQSFQYRLQSELPPVARITTCSAEQITATGDRSFVILTSGRTEHPTAYVSPDIAICDDCLAELLDPNDRRYRYPFINCTNCGPRYTIVDRIPYDRPNTSMKSFPMCPECQAEYDDPSNRRFHAQPNACPVCGPQVTLRSHDGQIQAADPISETIRLLQSGKIIAIRGIGGFHLAVDPRNETAVLELRRRKGRAEKPFALMARNLEMVKKYCAVSPAEENALEDRRRPIVLLRKSVNNLPESLAPRQACLGFMLPYTPLHHLLFNGPLDLLVMTSANYSEEPIAIGNDEAIERLAPLADYFLLHDREILQRCDDGIVKVMAGKQQIIRRSRGYVPEPIFIKHGSPLCGLAVGGELKSTVALSRDNAIFLSQHIGDLDNLSAYRFFESSISHLKRILEIEPTFIAHDLHPEYLSTKWALQQDFPRIAVQHHHAHLAAVMADNEIEEPCIGIILDGTGYGTDGTIWGGEVLVGDCVSFVRHSWLATTPMPGGEAAIKEPWRMAVSYLLTSYGSEYRKLPLPFLGAMSSTDLDAAGTMIVRKINSPVTSSCGRLFDGVAALLGIRSTVSFEAQAAMELEALSSIPNRNDIYHAALPGQGAKGPLDFRPLIRALVDDVIRGSAISQIGARFHATLAELFIVAAQTARTEHDLNRIALSGGVYQNQLFYEYMVARLSEEQFEVVTHRQVPTNDGGLAMGQLAVAHAQMRGGNGK